jgi:hypothetical protein
MVRLVTYVDVRSGGLRTLLSLLQNEVTPTVDTADCTTVYHSITLFLKQSTKVVGIVQAYMHPYLRIS